MDIQGKVASTDLPQIFRRDIYTYGKQPLTSVAMGLAKDVIDAKSDNTPLYILVDDRFRASDSDDKVLLASYYAGGAFSTLVCVRVVDNVVALASRLMVRHPAASGLYDVAICLDDPELFKKMEQHVLKHWPDWLCDQEQSRCKFRRTGDY